MRGNEQALLAVFYVALLGIALFSVYYFDAVPGSPENLVIVNMSVTSGAQQESVPEYSQSFTVREGQHVTLVLDNTDDAPHELAIPALNVISEIVNGGQTVRVSFVPEKVGTFDFGQPTSCPSIQIPCPLAMNGAATVLAP